MKELPRTPERLTEGAERAVYLGCEHLLRPAICPTCRRHYTMVKPSRVQWGPGVMRVECGCFLQP